MTVWDSMNLNAPHTASELAAEADTTPSGTTEQQDATSPSAGLSVASVYDAGRVAGWHEAAAFLEGATQVDLETGEETALSPEAVATLALSGVRAIANKLAATIGKEVMPDDEASSNARPATSPGVTAGATLAIVTAEKASWPHAGSMHDGARMACDAIAERVKKLMGEA